MKHSYSVFPVFNEQGLENVLVAGQEKLRAEVEGQPDDYLLNVNETTYVDYLVGKYSVDNLALDFDSVSVSEYEKDIPSQRSPGQKIRRLVLRWHVPFSGDSQLLHCIPNPHIVSTCDVTIQDDCLCFDFDITNFSDVSPIRREADSTIRFLKEQSGHVINQVADFNGKLPRFAKTIVENRKARLLNKNRMLSTLGVPIRKRAGVTGTFAIPSPRIRQRIMVSKPVVTERGFRSEPTLEAGVYASILQVIQDVGKQFERMPSTYAGKEEEHLRDHFLLSLEPNFEGTATGETFNKTGKTDILLRYDGSNVFVAECKFWQGAKGYLDTITQLLGYLTWRDSKAAVILFVDRKDFSNVLKTVETETAKHPNYLGFVSKNDETWFNYRFHINDDPNREVKLAVLLFHIPPL